MGCGPKLCPKVETAFEILGKRWSGLIIHVLLGGAKRFNEISDIISGMSDRMLAERLKELEAAGIVKRHVFPETPVRIQYQLTEKGQSLEPVIRAVSEWAEQWATVPAE